MGIGSSASEEPENLSLKPEDRFAVAERERHQEKRLRALLEAAAMAAASPSLSPPPAHQPLKSWTPPLLHHPLEPLHLNNQTVVGVPPQMTQHFYQQQQHQHPASYAPYLPFNFNPYRAAFGSAVVASSLSPARGIEFRQ